MSPEAQRIAIAEACGYEKQAGMNAWRSPVPASRCQILFVDELPDYLNDLNAMHEAENTLTPEQHADYRLELMLRVGYSTFHLATAAQRAEAFLRSLEKWRDAS